VRHLCRTLHDRNVGKRIYRGQGNRGRVGRMGRKHMEPAHDAHCWEGIKMSIWKRLEDVVWFCSLIVVVLTLSAMVAESFDK
jgi:hypothetical protein